MGVSNTVQQLSVFLENREGRLEEVLDVLAKKGVNIVALSLAAEVLETKDASRSIEIDLVALDKTNESVAKFERQGPNETRVCHFSHPALG